MLYIISPLLTHLRPGDLYLSDPLHTSRLPPAAHLRQSSFCCLIYELGFVIFVCSVFFIPHIVNSYGIYLFLLVEFEV